MAKIRKSKECGYARMLIFLITGQAKIKQIKRIKKIKRIEKIRKIEYVRVDKIDNTDNIFGNSNCICRSNDNGAMVGYLGKITANA